jgi:hypothetical protein
LISGERQTEIRNSEQERERERESEQGRERERELAIGREKRSERPTFLQSSLAPQAQLAPVPPIPNDNTHPHFFFKIIFSATK